MGRKGKKSSWSQFWTPIMVVLGITIIVMFLIILQSSGVFPAVDWSTVNPQILEFAPWIVVVGLAFVVFLKLRG